MKKIIPYLLLVIGFLTSGGIALSGQGSADVDVCMADSGDQLTFTYRADQDYFGPVNNRWNSQVITIRYPDGASVIWSDLEASAAFSFVEDPSTIPATDGGDGFLYKKFSANDVGIVQDLPAGLLLEVLSIKYSSTDPVDFELITGVPWTDNNNGTAAVNNAVLGNRFEQFSSGCQDDDNDGLPNIIEDADEDGVVDAGETDPNNPDTDDDGFPDGAEDANANGTVDTGESDPLDPCDPDVDALACPTGDTDDDGLTNDMEASLNTDPLDPDSDDDGLTDGEEVNAIDDPSTPADPGGNTSDPNDADSDDDGLDDGEEAGAGTDPNNADSDDDGLTDGEEITGTDDPATAADPGGATTDATNADTDGDGLEDGQETLDGSDPNDPCDPFGALTTDSDNDGLTDCEETTGQDDPSTPADPGGNTSDPNDADSDDDGLDDGEEANKGTDPKDVDTDDDGLNDGEESDQGTDPLDNDSDNDGLSDGEEVNDIGTDPNDADTDGGGVEDGVELEEGTDPLDPTDDISTVTVAPRLILQGAYESSSGLMRDDLRAADLIPLQEPYSTMNGFAHTGGETVSTNVLETSGNDAIVDWIYLELRSSTDAATLVATRAALLQRDGDVVDTDGVSPVSFEAVEEDDYYLFVRHRNHLGVLTADAYALSETVTNLDFTDSDLAAFGANARKVLNNGQLALWAGNTNGDRQIMAAGAATDVNAITNIVFTDPANTDASVTHIVPGYYTQDVDMNGKVVLSGAETDVFFITSNVLTNPGNVDTSVTQPIIEQQP